MKPAMLLLLMALVAAPACSGGESSDSGIGGSPGPLSATFVADQPTPGANTVAMLQGSKSNDVVNVVVTLTDTTGVFGAAFDVVFDETEATYLGFSTGIALEGGTNAPNYDVEGSANPGRIVVGVARSNRTTTNVTGTKAILTLQFRVKQPGTNPVTLQNAAVYNGDLTPQPLAGIDWYAGALTGV